MSSSFTYLTHLSVIFVMVVSYRYSCFFLSSQIPDSIMWRVGCCEKKKHNFIFWMGFWGCRPLVRYFIFINLCVGLLCGLWIVWQEPHAVPKVSSAAPVINWYHKYHLHYVMVDGFLPWTLCFLHFSCIIYS